MLPGDFTYLNPAIRLELDSNPLDPVLAMNYKVRRNDDLYFSISHVFLLSQKGIPIMLDSLATAVLAYPPHCVAYGDALVSGKAGVGESFQVKVKKRNTIFV